MKGQNRTSLDDWDEKSGI